MQIPSLAAQNGRPGSCHALCSKKKKKIGLPAWPPKMGGQTWLLKMGGQTWLPKMGSQTWLEDFFFLQESGQPNLWLPPLRNFGCSF